MKLLFIDPQSYSNLAMYDYNLLSNLTIKEIIFIGNELYDYKSLNSNINFKGIFCYSKKKSFLKILSYIFSLLKLLFIICKEKPSVIHLQWTRLLFVDWMFYSFVNKIIRIPIVYTAHNVLPHDYKNNNLKMHQRLYELVDQIIVHTERSKVELIDLFGDKMGDKINIIPHGLLNYDIDKETIDECINLLKNNYQLNDKRIFSSLGFQSYYKGIDMILEAWKQIPLSLRKNYRLLLIGKQRGIDYSSVKNDETVIVDERFVSNKEFVSLLRLSDVILLPYRKISQSGVLLSVIAEKKPVIVTDIGGLTDPFEIAKIGWILKDISSKSLAEKIVFLMENNSEIDKVKNDMDSWNRVHDYYNWESIALKTLNLYNKINKY